MGPSADPDPPTGSGEPLLLRSALGSPTSPETLVRKRPRRRVPRLRRSDATTETSTNPETAPGRRSTPAQAVPLASGELSAGRRSAVGDRPRGARRAFGSEVNGRSSHARGRWAVLASARAPARRRAGSRRGRPPAILVAGIAAVAAVLAVIGLGALSQGHAPARSSARLAPPVPPSPSAPIRTPAPGTVVPQPRAAHPTAPPSGRRRHSTAHHRAHHGVRHRAAPAPQAGASAPVSAGPSPAPHVAPSPAAPPVHTTAPPPARPRPVHRSGGGGGGRQSCQFPPC